MEQTVHISEELLRDARQMAEASERTLSAQIELWARLGRFLEPLLRGDQVVAMQQTSSGQSLSQVISEVDSEAGRNRVRDTLQAGPFPHFEAVLGEPGLLRKIEKDGSETVGKFVNRVFEPIELLL